MPSIHENRAYWDNDGYNWKYEGEEWSHAWGGSKRQWENGIFPRIKQYDLSGTILEIAPGYGRWSHYLQSLSDKYIGIDISKSCITACKKRFKDYEHMSFFHNDGKSLDSVPNESVDFIFSYDSLVHVESDVMNAYLSEIALKLKPDGVAFLHHSNLRDYLAYSKMRPNIEFFRGVFDYIIRTTPLDNIWYQWRATSVSAKTVAKEAKKHGLQCINQELITWSSKRALVDCMSTIVRNDSKLKKSNVIIKNRGFMTEAERSKKFAKFADEFAAKRKNS